MTQETVTDNISLKENKKGIKGISIASFLQMLEQERHTCRVQVHTDDQLGVLFFEHGNLIDAEYGHEKGINAAYRIVSWENPSIALGDPVSRVKKIDLPLGYILLNAAKQHDEQTRAIAKPTITYVSHNAENNSDFQNIINALTPIDGIQHFYILDQTGKIVIHSAPNPIHGELIIYCIVTSSNLRKWLHTKSPRQIHMHMKDGGSLLILPKAGTILGMVLDSHSSAVEISDQIDEALSITQQLQNPLLET